MPFTMLTISNFPPRPRLFLNLIARIVDLFQTIELFLNTPSTDKPSQERRTSRLVVCPTCPASTKWLLPYYAPGTLTVNVEITR